MSRGGKLTIQEVALAAQLLLAKYLEVVLPDTRDRGCRGLGASPDHRGRDRRSPEM